MIRNHPEWMVEHHARKAKVIEERQVVLEKNEAPKR